jgi:tripartite-type tricarboxylate transporter receptor subunit TctC
MKKISMLAAGMLAVCSFAVQAQGYPAKPIRLVVPFAPGGSSSIVARSIAAEMEKGLGQPIIVDNKPGGGGNVAMLEVARADPDGYTLIIGHVGSLAMNPFMYSKLPYDVDRDFAPVSLLAIVPAIFVVHESVPAKNLREFVALAKKEPGKLYYGSAGNGSAGHLAMEYLKQVTGMDIQHVPYKGTGPNIIDLVAGRTQAASAGTPPLMPHVKSGKLRVIAVGTAKRLHTLPDVGTVAEQGYPGFETSQWYGLNAPAKTPEAIIHRLSAEAAKAAKSPKVLERFAADDAEAVGSTPAEYGAFIRKEQERWGKVVRAAGVKAD